MWSYINHDIWQERKRGIITTRKTTVTVSFADLLLFNSITEISNEPRQNTFKVIMEIKGMIAQYASKLTFRPYVV